MRAFAVTLLVIAVAAPAAASICAFDAAPAATLLFPYVVFDYNRPLDGQTTLIAITNTSPEAQVVHVTLWTDTGYGLFNFYIVLAGRDVQTFNVRDLLVHGRLPRTGTAGEVLVRPNQPPYDDGPVSYPNAPWVEVLDLGEASDAVSDTCSPDDRAYPDYPLVPQAVLALLESYFRFSQLYGGYHIQCGIEEMIEINDWWGQRDETQPVWFSITVDVVDNCRELEVPEQSVDHWQLPEDGGQARYDNVLIGDVFWVGPGYSGVDRAVHIEADQDLASVATVDDEGAPISFYYRHSTLRGQPSDSREPLPTAWAFRYVGWLTEGIDTYLRVWKGSTFLDQLADLNEQAAEWIADDCLAYTYFAWDEDSNPYYSHTGWPWYPPYKPNLLPLAVQEIHIDQLNLVDPSGWVLFLWPPSNWAGSDLPLPDRYQTWMGVRYATSSGQTGAMTAIPMANANCFSDQELPHLGIDYDYVTSEGYVTSPP